MHCLWDCKFVQTQWKTVGSSSKKLKIELSYNPTEVYKKGLNDQGIHNGVVTHLKPDILKCEVKWALGSITTNKTSRGDRILAEIFQP